MGFFFQDAPDSTNEQREQLITNADVLLKAFIVAAYTVDGVQFSIVRKRPVYRDMAGTYSGYLVDFTLSLTEDICNGDTPSVIIPVGKTFCELVDECLGISISGEADYFLNEQGDWVQVQGGGGAVDSVNGQTGAVVLTKCDIGLGNVDNTSDVNKPVSTAQAAADTAVLNASKSYADGLVTGLLDDRGNYDASSNLFPSSGGSGVAGAILKGDLWTVNVAGTLGGVSVTNGDVVRALTDSPGQTASNWAVSENNIGYVAENQANKSSTMAGNEASTSIYLSAKGVYDWATSVFTTTSAVALQIATALSGYATQAWVTSQGYITNVISALGFTPENVANKQNSLATDGTGAKYPTVDAVNAALSLLSFNPSKVSYYDDFIGGVFNLTAGLSSTSHSAFYPIGGTPRINTMSSPFSDAAGVLQCETQASAISNALVGAVDMSLRCGSGVINFTSRVRIETLSAGTNRYDIFSGLANRASFLNQPICFRYSDNVNSGKWQLVTQGATADSGITVNAGQWYILKIVVNAAGTSAEFFIDGVSVGTLGSLPTSSFALGAMYGFRKSIGTTNRNTYVDYQLASQDLNFAR